MLKAIFFDAAGTLIYLPRTVGEHYREVAADFGVELDAGALNAAFKRAWKSAPPRSATKGAREDDDKGWWRELVRKVFAETLSGPQAQTFNLESYFEAVYAHFAEAGVWEVYPDVRPTLEKLRADGLKLGIISNFDRRLRTILDHLELSRFFDTVVISSEVGADKPDPQIFGFALSALRLNPSDTMHVGDDPEKDWGAEACGLQVFRLDRPKVGLDALLRRRAEGD